MGIIRNIRSEIDEPYRIRHGFGLSVIRSERELKALIDFCNLNISDCKETGLSSSFLKTWKNTVELYIDMSVAQTPEEEVHYRNRLIDYINEHFREYWS